MPLHRLSKRELVRLATTRCKHGHTYLSHYGCYEAEQAEKVGYLDIETSNLDADFGIILSYCIKDAGSNAILEGTLTEADIAEAKAGCEDRRVVEALVDDIQKFDRLVTYYGSRFDVPYARTRALITGVAFPIYGALTHTDLYYVLKHRFKLSSNRLENACRTLLGKTQKTRIENRFWRGGVRGDAKSLRYILDHNRKDVLDLERLYRKVIMFSKGRAVTI